MTAWSTNTESATWELAGGDGAALMVHSWLPRNGGGRWSLVALHGAVSHAGWFAPLGRALARRGIAVHAPDRRGSGRLRQLELPAAPEVFLDDLRRVVRAVRARGLRVCLAPWCQGAQLGVPALGDACQVDHLLLLAPALALSDKVAGGLDAGARAAGSHISLPAADDDFVEGSASRAFLAADPLRWRSLPRTFCMVTDRLDLMMRAQLPLLTSPVTGVFASRDRITDSAAGSQLLADLGHTSLSVDGSHGFFLDDPDRAADLIGGVLC